MGRKIGFAVQRDCHGCCGPVIIPVDMETGEKIDGVVAVDYECELDNISTMTIKILVGESSRYTGEIK